MANALVLETLSLKELGALGSSVRLKYWQHLRKSDLLERLAALNRVFTQEDLDVASVALARKQAARAARIRNAQNAVSPDLLNARSDVPLDDAPLASETSKVDAPTRDAGKSPAKSDSKSFVSTPGKERVPEETERSSASTVEGAVASTAFKSPRTTDSDSADETPKEAKVETSHAHKTSNSLLNVEKVVSIADQIVPMLAERLARRLAECLTKELALGNDLDAQEIVRSISKDEDVASQLVEGTRASSTDVSANEAADSAKTEAKPGASIAEDARTKANGVKGTPQSENVSSADASQEKTDDESDDDEIIETILPATGASKSPAKRPADGTPSLKDKLRLKKFIGSPHDKNDRLVLMVCDPYWIRACWEVTSQLVERVRSAMSRHWHTADPILRLYRIDATTSRREFVKDVEISGGVSNWYVPVENPPTSFMVELGYKSRDGQFFTLLSSNAVQTPKQFVRDADGRPCTESFNAPFNFQTSSHDRWMQKSRQAQAERRSSLDEKPDKTFTPSESAVGTSLSTNDSFVAPSSFLFQADAEILFTGRVSNGATVKVREEPVCQAQDGSFSIRFSLPERRHVFPIVATSLDENETQTIIIAIERNTKTLDPVYKEDDVE